MQPVYKREYLKSNKTFPEPFVSSSQRKFIVKIRLRLKSKRFCAKL